MNSPDVPAPADQLLRHYSRWNRLAWPLTILAIGLGAVLAAAWWQHPSPAKVDHWGSLPLWWVGSMGVILCMAVGVWLVQRKSLLRHAQRLDDRLHAKNRLETAAAYRHDAGVLASAQREEAAAFLRQQPAAPSRRAPLIGLAILVAALVVLHGVTFLSWSRPWLKAPLAVAKPAATPAPPELPKARIKWKLPKAETKAVPIEEVPLQAVAASSSGLRNLSLEIAVNGQSKLSVPIPADELKAEGAHPIQTSIYLDQVEVEPFDVVSYYLRAERIDARKLPETTSTVQFVQIKRFRDDVREMRGGEGNAGFALITALKVAQLRLLKENFVLGHTDLGQDNEDWKRENGRVGSEEAALEKKTGEAIEQLIQESVPAEIINLLTQAKPVMKEAAEKIVTVANVPALMPQGKALSLITEVEKYMHKAVARDGIVHGKKPSVDDPFHDKQQIEMKQRFKTVAGELEVLAAAQAKLADDLAKTDAANPPPTPAPVDTGKTPDPDEISGTPTERQTQISQRIGAILNGKVFNPEITGHLEKGHEEALGSLRQLDAGDPPAAREPAATAARELKLAAEAMDRAGKEEAKELFAETQRELNDAAAKASEAASQQNEKDARQNAEQAAKEAEDSAKKLADEAKAQQETGSGDAAKRLAALANAIHSEAARKALEGLRAQPRDPAHAKAAADQLRQLADRTALLRQPEPLTKEEIARLAEQLEGIRANMLRLAANDALTKPGNAGTEKPRAPTSGVGERKKEDAKADESGSKAPGKEGSNPPGDGEAEAKNDSPGAQASAKRTQPPGSGQGKPEQKGAGKGEQGEQPGKGKGEQKERQSQGEGKGKQPGERPGKGQNPASQGQGGEGQPAEGKPGQSPGKGNGEGEGDGDGTAQNTKPTGQPGSAGQGNAKGRPSNENLQQTTGKGDGPGPGDDSDLGDTYGSKTGELQFTDLKPGKAPTQKPIYTDHASREAQTHDPQQAKEKFARELMEEVREDTQTAATVVPGSTALTEMREALQDVPVEMHYADWAAFFARIDPALMGLIHALRAQEDTAARRQHLLTKKDAELAPPAYRAAVSDYFEQLSRDYRNAPPSSDASDE